jgi:hypothetical protein
LHKHLKEGIDKIFPSQKFNQRVSNVGGIKMYGKLIITKLIYIPAGQMKGVDCVDGSDSAFLL